LEENIDEVESPSLESMLVILLWDDRPTGGNGSVGKDSKIGVDGTEPSSSDGRARFARRKVKNAVIYDLVQDEFHDSNKSL